MSNRKIVLIFILLIIILTIITGVVILLKGNMYTAEIPYYSQYNIDDILIEVEGEDKIVELLDKQFDGDILKLTFKSVSKGIAFFNIKIIDHSSDENAENSTKIPTLNEENQMINIGSMYKIYVHNFGIITFDFFFGDCTGSVLFPISGLILLSYVLAILIIKYRRSIKENIYRYKNIAYMGMIIFVCYGLINQITTITDSSQFGPLRMALDIMDAFCTFAIVFLPVAFITAVLITVSNIVLIRKEGLGLRNMLGLILGIGLCIMTMLPSILYRILNTSTIMDIHNQNGIGSYMYSIIEASIYTCTTYLECILLGTIILSIKASRRIPKFDKDYIIILGCKIKKDGTLTNLLKGRVDKAIEFSKMQKASTQKKYSICSFWRKRRRRSDF